MNLHSLPARSTLVMGLALITACADQTGVQPDIEPQLARGQVSTLEAQLLDRMDEINLALVEADADHRLMKMEYLLANGMGAELLARDVGNKRGFAQFVPFDSRRAWSAPDTEGNDNLSFAIDQVDAVPPMGGLGAAETNAMIISSLQTWEDVQCSELGLTQFPDFGIDIGLVAFFGGIGGSPFVFADIQYAGFNELDFTGALDGVLAVAYTFNFIIPATGEPTDVDNNGYLDTAFAEIYFDPSWDWTDGPAGFDVETISLHETGHALSQGHFGNLFRKKGVLRASPKAVMNAFYGGVQRSLLGTDNGGHCGMWANWPEVGPGVF
jgi:hypothetical protein